jgi:hypothetical protein
MDREAYATIFLQLLTAEWEPMNILSHKMITEVEASGDKFSAGEAMKGLSSLRERGLVEGGVLGDLPAYRLSPEGLRRKKETLANNVPSKKKH